MVPQYESEKFGKFSEQKGLKGVQTVQFECPRHSHPSVIFSFVVCKMALFHCWLSGVIRNRPQNESEKIENSQTKRGLKGCKWSSLNAPVT